MTTLQFIGTGAAFTMNNWHSNVVLTSKTGKRLLIDCGSDVRHALKEQQLSHLDIDAVYISHLHGDHIGGLEWLGFSTFFDPRYENRPKLYITEFLVDKLWNNCLSGGMQTIEGSVAHLNTFFKVFPVDDIGYMRWEGIDFQLVQTIHMVNGFSFEYSFGLLINVDEKQYFFTSDTQFAPSQLQCMYDMADVIFHECETLPFRSGVHSNYMDLCTLDEETKSKMWLYHYQDGELPDAVNDGFAGFVTKGQTFEL